MLCWFLPYNDNQPYRKALLLTLRHPDSPPTSLSSCLPDEHILWAWPSGRVRMLTGEFLHSTNPPSACVPPPTPRLVLLYLQTQVNLQ